MALPPKVNFQDKILNQAQIDRLTNKSTQYGGLESQQFQNKVNTEYGAGAYDQIKKNVGLSVSSGAVQGNTANANNYLTLANAEQKKVFDTGKGEMTDGTTKATGLPPKPTGNTIPSSVGLLDPKTGMAYDKNGKPFTGGTYVNGKDTGTTPNNNQLTNGATTINDTWNTGITGVDKAGNKLVEGANKSLETAKKDFLKGQQDLNLNKSYYKNFDEVNNKYVGVTNDLLASMNKNGVVADSTYQQIADKYGISVDQVKNPNNILQTADMTDEGKQKSGITSAQQQVTDLKTNFDRSKQDLTTTLDNTLNNVNQQIDDVGKQMAINTGWTEAMGAWQGSLKSSGFMAGIQNIKTDAQNTIDKLKQQATNINSAHIEDVKRLTDDFNKNYTQATQDLNQKINDLKTNNLSALSLAQTKYGVGSDELSKKIDDIMEKYGSDSLDLQSKYITNLKGINEVAKGNADLIDQMNKATDEKNNKRYNEYLANNGTLLQNVSLNTINDEVAKGIISADKANDLHNIMLSSIQATLNKINPASQMDTTDINTVNNLMNQGKTPAEIVATMQQQEKFKPESKDTLKSVILKDADGNEIPASYDEKTGKYTVGGNEYTGQQVIDSGLTSNYTGGYQSNINVTRTGNNVGVDTNNPGNITADSIPADRRQEYGNSIGAIGTYTSPNGRTYYVFPDMKTGLRASAKDISSKIAGGSSWAKPTTTLSDFVKGWTIGPNASGGPSQGYLSAVMGVTGANANTPISQIDPTLLAQGMAKGEGVNLNNSANIGVSSTTPVAGNKFDESTNVAMNKFADKGDLKGLAKDLGVNTTQAKQIYNQWKEGTNLNTYDEGLLASYLKDVSGQAVADPEFQRTKQRFLKYRNEDKMTTDEILDALGNYQPTPENKNNQSIKNQLTELRPYARAVGNEVSKVIASQINQGNYNKAVQELENATYKQKGVDSEGIRDIGATIKKGNDLKAKIQANEKEFGPITGWTNQQMLKFQDNPEVQGLMADMANFVAKYRNGIAGSSITSGETGFLEPLIADIKNQPKNALARVNSIQQSLISELNATRDNIGLPQLKDWRSAYDVNLRSQAYTGKGKVPTTPVTGGRIKK